MTRQEAREALVQNGQPILYEGRQIPLQWFLDCMDGKRTDEARFVTVLLGHPVWSDDS